MKNGEKLCNRKVKCKARKMREPKITYIMSYFKYIFVMSETYIQHDFEQELYRK
jgi:hypothetical protein